MGAYGHVGAHGGFEGLVVEGLTVGGPRGAWDDG